MLQCYWCNALGLLQSEPLGNRLFESISDFYTTYDYKARLVFRFLLSLGFRRQKDSRLSDHNG